MKILITGGSGSIGTSFIKTFRENEYFNISRNEENLTNFKREFPDVKNFIGSIENKEFLINVFNKVKPDVVIHAAAMKHVNLVEENPTQACCVNIIGSLNVVNASIACDVPITIGISTDKASGSENIYGKTKSIVEKIFLEKNNDKTKFALTRFANVAGSKGSVIPFWLKLNRENKPLKLTDPNMNRLFFSIKKSSFLIKNAIDRCQKDKGGFIVSTFMKSVNMKELSQIISNNIEIIGSREGERLNEVLISEKEIPYTYVEDNFIYIYKNKNSNSNKLQQEISSINSDKMSKQEMEDLINSCLS